MIPAILALPMVQGILSGVVGGVVNAFSPESSMPAVASTASTKSFAPMLDRAAQPAHTLINSTAPSGTLRSTDWGQMSDSDLTSWTTGLSGRHIDATDETGRTISGTVNGIQLVGHSLALNVSGHLVSLSQLKQVSWSPATV